MTNLNTKDHIFVSNKNNEIFSWNERSFHLKGLILKLLCSGLCIKIFFHGEIIFYRIIGKMDMKAGVDSFKYDDVAMESHVHHHVPSHHEFDAIDVDHKHNMIDGSRDSSNGHNMHNMQMHTNTVCTF
jgi:hypothetical protein